MRLLIAYILTFLCATPLWLNAQERLLHYIWHRKGVPVYNEPSARTVLDTLSYGTEVNIIEVRPEGGAHPLFTYQSDTVAKAYTHPSKWVLIEFGNRQRGYVLNTYLLGFPTNLTARMIDYFSQLSAIVEERNENKTERFCSRNSYTYKNGIRYTYTDLGPCEACGHGVTEISLPGWTLQQAFVFITNFDTELWNMDGKSIGSYLELVGAIEVKESYPGQLQWEHIHDLVTLTETEDGVEVQIDTIL
ncbi:SH3 domain-containing protein [Paenimyroides aquimaris]|uniref:SH3 domain-containing protein n=1 Tax=Paenimyroides marinum TaxID=1159016 RepID=A0A1H6MDD6_9FLAO|nr:SH3 domain-containing protein [Paenimyroides aquimaris]